MNYSVYIETSVISYLTARISRDLIVAGHQQITQEWWDNILPKLNAFISEAVILEASKGDVNAVKMRMQKLKHLKILEINSDVQTLADLYSIRLKIPKKAAMDALHLATASWHGMDYLVTWNCAHIANARTELLMRQINSEKGIETPVICTPEELMEV